MHRKLCLDLTTVDTTSLDLPTSGDRFIYDEVVPELALRLRHSGARTWVIRTGPIGNRKRQTLGNALTLPVPDARRLAQTADDDGASDSPPLPKNITVADLLPRYLAYGRKGQWKPSTDRLMAYLAEKHIVPTLGDKAAKDIQPTDVVLWHQALATRTSSERMALSTLSGLMRYAEDHGIRPIGSNPCKGLRKKAKNGRGSHLPNAVIKCLWDALAALQEKIPDACDAVRLLLLTGARRQEILGLEWDAIVDRRAVLEDSKEGARTIWLNAPARALLDERRDRICGPYVFPAMRLDGPRTIIDREWKAIRAHADLPGLRLHDLRHHFAAVGVSNGIDLIMVGQLLGHAEIESTLIYAHLSTASLTRSASKVSRLIDRAMRPDQPTPRSKPNGRPQPPIRASKLAQEMGKEASHG